jgi:hypothetical protein
VGKSGYYRSVAFGGKLAQSVQELAKDATRHDLIQLWKVAGERIDLSTKFKYLVKTITEWKKQYPDDKVIIYSQCKVNILKVDTV